MAFQAARKALIRLQCMPLDPARLHSAAGDGYLVSVDDGDSWSAGGQCIYLYHLGELAAKIYRLDLKTGKKQYWKSLMPPDLAGDQTEKGRFRGRRLRGHSDLSETLQPNEICAKIYMSENGGSQNGKLLEASLVGPAAGFL